jgi:hypothetical protein
MFVLNSAFIFQRGLPEKNSIRVYPSPPGEPLSTVYHVSSAGKNVPVYIAKIGAADDNRRFKAVDDLMHSADYFDTASFAYFDMEGTVNIKVAIGQTIRVAKILPLSANIKAMIHDNFITFKVSSPQNLTVEINGEWVKSLHIFINQMDKNIPKPDDKNVIFFGPGIHEVSSLTVGDNKTVYIAGGAIIKAVIGKDEKYSLEPSGLRNYSPTFILAGNHIKFTGRGIIDASGCPTHARSMLSIKGSDIKVEGVILTNSSGWTIPVFQSENIEINNVKILGYRANSDGIDICNGRNITVNKCFIRTNDDLVTIKCWQGQGPSNHIIVKNCVLWNQLAHALLIGPELRETVNDVAFTNCDIIHDQGREWSLRVFQSDSTLVNNIRFENIRIEEAHQLISLWIGKNASTFQKNSGKVQNVTFKNIDATGTPLSIALIGDSGQNMIKNVFFENVKLNGKKLIKDNIRSNQFVEDVSILP